MVSHPAGTSNHFSVATIYTRGESAGRVLILNSTELARRLAAQEITPLDWIVVDELPQQVDAFPVAGIVVTRPVLRGTHWDSLCERMAIPVLLQPDALADPHWRQLADSQQFHRFHLNGKSLEVSLVADAEIALNIVRSRLREENTFRPIDFEQSEEGEVLSLERKATREAKAYGDKTAEMATSIDASGTYPFPSSVFAAPFRAMRETLAPLSSAIEIRLRALEAPGITAAHIATELGQIREQILSTPIARAHLQSIFAQLDHTQYEGRAIRIRTSSRGEDRMGAGLYDSVRVEAAKAGNLAEWRSRVELAIRRVYASFFSLRGYWVRRLHQAPIQVAGMALLIHKSYDDAPFHGVAHITASFGNMHGTVLEYGQGSTATNPTPGVISEEYGFSHLGSEVELWRWRGNNYTPSEFRILDAERFHRIQNVANQLRLTHYGRFKDLPEERVELKTEWIWARDLSDLLAKDYRHVLLQTSVRDMGREPLAATAGPLHFPPALREIYAQRLGASHAHIPAGLAADLRKEGIVSPLEFAYSRPRVTTLGLKFFLVEISGRPTLLCFKGDHRAVHPLLSGLLARYQIPLKSIDFGDLQLRLYPDPQTQNQTLAMGTLFWGRGATGDEEERYLGIKTERNTQEAGFAIRQLIESILDIEGLRVLPEAELIPTGGVLTRKNLAHWLQFENPETLEINFFSVSALLDKLPTRP